MLPNVASESGRVEVVTRFLSKSWGSYVRISMRIARLGRTQPCRSECAASGPPPGAATVPRPGVAGRAGRSSVASNREDQRGERIPGSAVRRADRDYVLDRAGSLGTG